MTGRGGTWLLAGAGWLFADLMVVMVLVVLGGQSTPLPVAAPSSSPSAAGSPSAPASSSASSSSSPTSPAPKPTATAPAPPPGLDPNSTSVVVEVDVDGLLGGDPAARTAFANRLKAEIGPYTGRSAALVFVWGTAAGCAHCTADLGRSQGLADAAAPLVHAVAPGFFPADDRRLIRPYLDGQGRPGTVRLELFFIRT
ncbi:hypothetical protein RMN57_04570 [Kitasatospora sp. CM 4170]|uniref:Uncharacterized protein n=1 Tax=Kitasatospora aburaviensis TaxID=67265 RepID=A0ABW1ESZ4_9ACTN|nr:hypothetical protein [Kitasatospora sp. CM 4170]WNM44035.1 hypothetical protein RMN57_04570 [Kitasatospora sp. CM 4170]